MTGDLDKLFTQCLGEHKSCPVMVREHGVIRICPCDCRECKRLWWDQGRPIVRDGTLVFAPKLKSGNPYDR